MKVHSFKYFATIMCNIIIQKKCNFVHPGQNKYGKRWCQYDIGFQQHAYSSARQTILFPNIYVRMRFLGYPHKACWMLTTMLIYEIAIWKWNACFSTHFKKWSTNIFISQWLINVRLVDKEIEEKKEKKSKMLTTQQKRGKIIPMAMG